MAKPLDSRVEEILQGGNPPLLSRIEKLLQEGGAGGGVSPEQIAAAVAAYLDEHGVTVTETDPTVPEWAKAETKPSYTATEVGALSAGVAGDPDSVYVYDGTNWAVVSKSAFKEQFGIPSDSDIATKLDKAQGAANAGKFMVVGSDGNITAVTMQAWSGGSY